MKYYLIIVIIISPFFLFGQTQVLNRAYLEDDYAQREPLKYALKYKFRSIEVDVHLVDGELLISNKHPSPRHKNTLEQLYLLPLKLIVEQNNGFVYPNYQEPFYLILDIKSEAGTTFGVLSQMLLKYQNILQKVENGKLIPGPIAILLSGNRPIPHLWNENKRLMAVLGKPEDMEVDYPNHFMPIISANFKTYATWNGNGKIANHESNWLKRFCNKVHGEGRMVHFFSYPERSIVWNKLLECGVDFINTQKPKKLARFFNNSPHARVDNIPVAVVTRNKDGERVEVNTSKDIQRDPATQEGSTSSGDKATNSVDEIKQPSVILANGHAHNDYEQARPFYDAISQGYTSLEVDIHLIDGELYVYHDKPSSPDPDKTLQKLYLEPLINMVKENNNKVYKNHSGEFYLLIDIKSEANQTYGILRKQLLQYSPQVFTRVNDNKIINGPVTIILSGNRPIEKLSSEQSRLVFLDGRPGDLQRGYSSNLMPLISDRFSKHFKWDGLGQMPLYELEYLQRLVQITHDEGKKIRFWGSPDNTTTWNTLLVNGVDLINTDKLKPLAQFLREDQ